MADLTPSLRRAALTKFTATGRIKKRITLQVCKPFLFLSPGNTAQEGAAQHDAAQQPGTRQPGDPGEDRGWHGGGWFGPGSGGGGSKLKSALRLGHHAQGLGETEPFQAHWEERGGRKAGNGARAGGCLGTGSSAVVPQPLTPTLTI